MNSTPFPVPLADGAHIVPIPGAAAGPVSLVLAAATAPGAGTVSLDYRLPGDPTWRPLPDGQDRVLTAPVAVWAYGPLANIRATISGLSGGAGLTLWVTPQEPRGFPPGSFEGLRALTMQGYVEANVKNGTQYEASSLVPALAAGASIDTIMVVGPSPVLIKARQVSFNGASMVARVYRTPTYTGGTPVPYFNLNDRNPVPGLAVVLAGAAVSAPGVEIAAPTYMVGTEAQGSHNVGSYALAGAERLLAAGSTYLLRLTNDDANEQRVAAYVSWYQGGTDLPIAI